MAVHRIDEKDDESQWLAVFFCVKEVCARELEGPAVGRAGTEFFEDTHDSHVMKGSSGVFAARNL